MTGADEVVLAVDLGGTQIRTAIFDPGGVMLDRRSVPTPRRASAVIAALVAEIGRSAADCGRSVRAIGVSALGPVDPRTGVIRSAPTLDDFHHVPLKAELEAALDRPVRVFNDANAAAVAEWRLGAGRGTRDFCYVTVSTGIGCGIIADGRLLTGHTGQSGEFGRTRIPVPNGSPVRLEEVSSGTAIARVAARAVLEGGTGALADRADPVAITSADVAEAARGGDQLAGSIVVGAAETLGLQLANLVRLVDPEVIALGGGLTQAGAVFWDPLRAAVRRSLDQDDIPLPRLDPARLGGDAGLYGAALLIDDDVGRW